MSQTSSSVEVLDTGTRWHTQDGLLLEVEDLRVEFRTRYGWQGHQWRVLRSSSGRDPRNPR
jgi:hypothetical protein